MSPPLGHTSVVRLSLENVLMEKSHHASGFVEGVMYTGYQGFLAVPSALWAARKASQKKTSPSRP